MQNHKSEYLFYTITIRDYYRRMNTLPVKDIIAAVGAAEIAKALGCRPSAVHNWTARGRIPAEHCPTIERLSRGEIRAEQMRPDVEWAVIRATGPVTSSVDPSDL